MYLQHIRHSIGEKELSQFWRCSCAFSELPLTPGQGGRALAGAQLVDLARHKTCQK